MAGQLRRNTHTAKTPASFHALVPGVLLNKGEISDHVFYPFQEERDIEVVNVVGLLAIIEQAVEEFLKVAPSIVPNSQQAKINALKAP